MRGEPDWGLTDEQFKLIEPFAALWILCVVPPYAATEADEKRLDEFVHSEAFVTAFGEMSPDEAWDRYETTVLFEQDGLTEVERAMKEKREK